MWHVIRSYVLSRPATAGEGRVIAWLVMAVPLGLGVYCLYRGYNAPAHLTAEREFLVEAGVGFLITALVAFATARLVYRLFDR